MANACLWPTPRDASQEVLQSVDDHGSLFNTPRTVFTLLLLGAYVPPQAREARCQVHLASRTEGGWVGDWRKQMRMIIVVVLV